MSQTRYSRVILSLLALAGLLLASCVSQDSSPKPSQQKRSGRLATVQGEALRPYAEGSEGVEESAPREASAPKPESQGPESQSAEPQEENYLKGRKRSGRGWQ